MQIPTTVSAARSGTDAVATLNGMMFPAKLLRLVVNGPAGSRADIYLGGQRIDQTARGQSNTADYSNPVEIPAGTAVFVRWSGQGTLAAQCNATFTVER
jgi:hypothetical protein